MIDMDELLSLAVDENASDVHLAVGIPPKFRIHGQLKEVDVPPLSASDAAESIGMTMNERQKAILKDRGECDFAYSVGDKGRFRVNVYMDKGNMAAAYRKIDTIIPKPEQLGLPPAVVELYKKKRGLVLVTGPTGSGKSTTLAAMIDYINRTRAEHILTIEDPIEFVHKSKLSVIHQRELGMDTRSFANALKSALREDPDIILVGEMRDHETIALALTAAETGHLVFGTLHTSSASQTIDRIIDVFPQGQQQQIRVQLANSLVAVFAQTLLPKQLPDGTSKGRVMAQEIMVVTPAVSNLIREAKAAQIYSTIQTSSEYGMQTLEASLAKLVNDGLVSIENAMAKSSKPAELQRLIRR